MERDPHLVQISPEEFFTELELRQSAENHVAQAMHIDDQAEIEQNAHLRISYEASEIAGKRQVTDPYSAESTIRPRESISMRSTGMLRLLGKIARSNTVSAEDFNENRAETPGEEHSVLLHDTTAVTPEENMWLDNEPVVNEAQVAKRGLFTAARNILAERRNRKQSQRQEWSQRAEKVYGTRVGKGKKAGIGTKINRLGIWTEANKRYLSGEISAKDRKDIIRDWTPFTIEERAELRAQVKSGHMTQAELAEQLGDFGIVYTSPSAVRREVRRERAGAAYNHVRSKRPVTNARKRKAREETLEAVHASIEERDALHQELAVRNNERIIRHQKNNS